ncbi:MAG: hypothetical protein R3D57_01785 [Hyphomicrobiaceae bacterium]
MHKIQDRKTAMPHTSDTQIRDHFLYWQCRLRQIATRSADGRPSPGMRPRVLERSGALVSEALTVLIVPLEPKESTAYFRFNVQRSNDPRAVFDKGLQYLQSTYFQKPELFSDELTALFGVRSKLADRMLSLKTCLLEFDELSQNFKMLAKVRRLKPREAAFQATLWHNRTFNPAIPNDAIVLGLKPDWSSAQAHPE